MKDTLAIQIEQAKNVIEKLKEWQLIFEETSKEKMLDIIAKEFELDLSTEKGNGILIKLYTALSTTDERQRKHLILVAKMEAENEILKEELKELQKDIVTLSN